jgi:hypothetical protein
VCCRYKQEGRWQRDTEQQQQTQQQGQQQQQQTDVSGNDRRRWWLGRGKQQRHGQQFSYAHACLHTHYLAGEERFRVEWDKTDDSVW